MKHRTYFNWSGGKDSALALYYALKDNRYSVEKLVTNLSSQYRRISMHGVREALLEAQAASIGIPLQKLFLPDQPSMSEYESYMTAQMADLKKESFSHALFGDIFLEDLKYYREQQLKNAGLEAGFPLWKRNTTELMNEFIDLGFKTIVVCTNSSVLDDSFAGRVIDKDFLRDLPKGVDPCGENGEFHTFVYDGPIFKEPIKFTIGEKVLRKYEAPKDEQDKCFSKPGKDSSIGFWFSDLILT